ncbi:MAG TPA: hypothetical protein VNG90_00270 [Candidatus Acidoferrum sp.]|nr:hypothetical protein [Candidatus Acidoferrum sp.]
MALVGISVLVVLFESDLPEFIVRRASGMASPTAVAALTIVVMVLYAAMILAIPFWLVLAIRFTNNRSRPWVLVFLIVTALPAAVVAESSKFTLAGINFVAVFDSAWLICSVVYAIFLIAARMRRK